MAKKTNLPSGFTSKTNYQSLASVPTGQKLNAISEWNLGIQDLADTSDENYERLILNWTNDIIVDQVLALGQYVDYNDVIYRVTTSYDVGDPKTFTSGNFQEIIFVLIDGSGTTANGKAIDIGGDLADQNTIIKKQDDRVFHIVSQDGHNGEQQQLILSNTELWLHYGSTVGDINIQIGAEKSGGGVPSGGGLYMYAQEIVSATESAGIQFGAKNGIIKVGDIFGSGRAAHMQYDSDYSAKIDALSTSVKDLVIPPIKWILANTTIELNTWYVSSAGNDTTGDGRKQKPYLTLQKAHDIGSSGDTIKILGQTYFPTETPTFTKSIIIDGRDLSVGFAANSGDFTLTGTILLTLFNFHIIGKIVGASASCYLYDKTNINASGTTLSTVEVYGGSILNVDNGAFGGFVCENAFITASGSGTTDPTITGIISIRNSYFPAFVGINSSNTSTAELINSFIGGDVVHAGDLQQKNSVIIGSVTVTGNYTISNQAGKFHELSADPSDPSEGNSIMWQSDGTGSGDDGDIMMKITAVTTTKTLTLVDFSTVLLKKIINIGIWNMSGTSSTTVSHGLTLSKIRGVSVMVRNDADDKHYPLDRQAFGNGAPDGGVVEISSSLVQIGRLTSGFFDSTAFDNTSGSYNRGWVTIEYEA